MNIELPLLHSFIRIVELGSFRLAADEQRLTPAAISKQIARLESLLNTQLLQRTTRSLSLTESGKQFFDQAKRVMEEVAACTSVLQTSKSTPQGDLKVLAARHFAMKHIIPYIPEFLQQYPLIQLNLDISERIPHFEYDDIDIAAGMSLPATGQVVHETILSTHYVYCASPEYIRSYGAPHNEKELAAHTIITHSMRQEIYRQEFGKQELGLPKRTITVNDAEAMKLLALQGVGIAKLHHYVVEEAMRQGELFEIVKPKKQQEIPLFVAYKDHRYLPSKIRAFLEHLKKNCI